METHPPTHYANYAMQEKNSVGHTAFDYSQRILHAVKVVSSREERLELRVQFDPQIIKLFKEVRNLHHLGFGGKIPLSIRVESLQAKEKCVCFLFVFVVV
jgi:hypothetical protein